MELTIAERIWGAVLKYTFKVANCDLKQCHSAEIRGVEGLLKSWKNGQKSPKTPWKNGQNTLFLP